jgi:uncharacterized metal-binding protein
MATGQGCGMGIAVKLLGKKTVKDRQHLLKDDNGTARRTKADISDASFSERLCPRFFRWMLRFIDELY